MFSVRILCRTCGFITDFFETECLMFLSSKELVSCEECDSKEVEIYEPEEVIE